MSVERARRSRAEPAIAEQVLWRLLRAHQFSGFKFRPQHPIGAYVADFACPAARLVIELDGGQHDVRAEQDAERTAELRAPGWHVIRFWNTELLNNPKGVLHLIGQALHNNTSPP